LILFHRRELNRVVEIDSTSFTDEFIIHAGNALLGVHMAPLRTALIAVGLLALATSSFAQDTTVVNGTIPSTTWLVANSPYRVTGNITIPLSETLKIQPGVEILFTSGKTLNVIGELDAIGTHTDSIRFIPEGTDTWGGIWISGGDSSAIGFARISGVSTGASYGAALVVSGSRLSMNDVVISGNINTATSGAGGLSLHSTARVTAAYCTFSNNYANNMAGGVGISQSFASFIGCEMSSNSGGTYAGVEMASSVVDFVGCDISSNTMRTPNTSKGAGVHINSSTTDFDSCTVNGNFGGRGIATDGNSGNTYFWYGEINGNTHGGIRSACNRFDIRYSTINGNSSTDHGGAANCNWGVLYIYRCEVNDNLSSQEGGGVYSSGTTYVYYSTFSGNTASNGGAVSNHLYFRTHGSVYTLNQAGTYGGAIYMYGTTYVGECTVAGNTAANTGGGLYAHSHGTGGHTRSTIVRNNSPNGYTDATNWYRENSYSLFQETIVSNNNTNNVGNLNTDPKFVDVATGDFRLAPDSPCLHTGYSGSKDPDQTRRDMGAFYLESGTMTAPTFGVSEDMTVTVPIRATYVDAQSVDIAILCDSTLLIDGPVTVVSHAFENAELSEAAANVVGDTIFVVLASDTPFTLDDTLLVEIAFDVSPPELNGSRPFDFLPYPYSKVNDRVTGLVNGEVFLRPQFGDVSADGMVTAFDAATTLQFLVHLISEIDTLAADVSGNGMISAYDAAWILMRVMAPSLVFPVEEGFNAKMTALGDRMLSWHAHDGAWALMVDDPSGVRSAEFDIVLDESARIGSEAGDMLISHRDGEVVRIGLARVGEGETELIRVVGGDAPPSISRAMLNETPVAAPLSSSIPIVFALEQNAPNPFNPTTMIRFTVAQSAPVNLAIYNLNGQLVREVVNGEMHAGSHEAIWDGRDAVGREVSSGVYVYRLRSGVQTAVNRMTLVR
jgi:hypothetical protein